MSPSDQELWAAVVAARRELHRAQAAFYQNAVDRTEALRTALSDRGWDQTTALRYLDSFSDSTLELLPELVELAVSDRTHGWACEAISHIPLDKLIPVLAPIIADRLSGEDEYEYRCIAGLLSRVQAWGPLGELMRRALASEDRDVHELGEDVLEWHPFLREAS